MPPVSEAEPELEQEGNLKHSDCLCPICLEIFLEPVTLPCAHTFCKPCFLETVDKANICCPLCRKRVSTWARINGRNKTLVNVELWKRIQDAFPTQCQRRLSGIDDDENMNTVIPKPKVCQPGELRQEYEDQISKFVEEKRALEEAERRASEEYIQRLLAEEEQRVAEERRRQEERQLEDDEKLARLLSEELNSSPVLEPQKNVKVNDAASSKKKKTRTGHIEKYLCPVSVAVCMQPQLETKPSSSLLANKENILNTPTFSQSPKEHSNTEVPFWTCNGKPCTSNSGADASKKLSKTANTTNISTKRKTIDSEQAVESELRKKQCLPPQPVMPFEDFLLQEQAMREEDLMKRLTQEDEDRKLAQRLQRELDRESAVNRRKGSADGYLLRQKISPSSTSTKQGAEDKGRKASPQSSTKKADGLSITSQVQKKVSGEGAQLMKKSPGSVHETPFSTSLIQKGNKQTTLTEMFPKSSS